MADELGFYFIPAVFLANLITTLLTKLRPAIQASQYVAGCHNTSNPDFVAAVVQNSIRNSIKDIRAKSAVIKEMEDKGEIKVFGSVF